MQFILIIFLMLAKKIYSGSFGDYSLYSFNIMKNISALYGGGISHNDKEFYKFIKNESRRYKAFPLIILLKQICVYFFLKIFSNKIIYRYMFFYIVKFAHYTKKFFFIKNFYPSLKFKKIKFPKYYFSKISNLSLRLIYLQLSDKQQRNYNYKKRLENNSLYYELLNQDKIKNIKLPIIKDPNFQNFIDFPIMVKKKRNL